MPQEEKMTADSFDPDAYAETLREQGYKDEVIPDLVAKKKESLSKNEDSFEYVMKLEQIGKSENDHIIIAGFASDGSLDHDSEVVNQESLQIAFGEYMKNPVLRYMHGKDERHPDAIGRIIPEYLTGDGKTLKTEFVDGKPFIIAEISNAPDVESIRMKVQEGILKGFSIGGKAKRVSEFCDKIGKNINRIFVNRLSEISIVDLPANKEGFFDVVKGCVGNACDTIIYEPVKIEPEIIEPEIIEPEINKKETDNMSEDIEMDMNELKEFVKSTVSDMISEQEAVEKAEAGEAAIVEALDLKARIVELEAQVTAMAEQLKNAPQEAMKSEGENEENVQKSESETESKPDEIVHKSEQVEQITIEKGGSRSLIGNIINTVYGGI